MSFAIRAAGPHGDIARAAVQALEALDSKVPPFEVQPLESVVTASMAERRFSLLLIATFAAVALLLAAVGLYGVVAYSVRQRTREIGVRMALGADAGRIVAMVARESGWMLGIGLLAGAGGALITARLLASFLVGIGPADPTALGTAGLVLALAAAAATVVPVQRATRVDAAVALGSE
jgi:ABC-type antimicrobial peptide transport system permease subunit